MTAIFVFHFMVREFTFERLHQFLMKNKFIVAMCDECQLFTPRYGKCLTNHMQGGPDNFAGLSLIIVTPQV